MPLSYQLDQTPAITQNAGITPCLSPSLAAAKAVLELVNRIKAVLKRPAPSAN